MKIQITNTHAFGLQTKGVAKLRKKTVAVIFGGASSEYEVSLMSASSVLRNIPREKYDVIMLGITKEGKWYKYEGEIDKIENGSWVDDQVIPAFIGPDSAIHGVTVLKEQNYENIYIDAVFPVLHGKNGEDGTIQGIFEMAKIPFVGCDHVASANCMDKAHTHMILDNAGIKTAEYVVARSCEPQQEVLSRVKERIGYPCFVKPANAGSSVGVGKAKNKDELALALQAAFQHDTKVVVEKAIVGKEIECAVLGNENPASSEPGEIAPISEFYDYEAKYIDGTTELYIPARISKEMAEKVKVQAVKAYKVLNCAGLTRVDFFVTEQGEIVLNEPNTIPGFTSISMYPKLWEYTGLPYRELIEKLIELALER